MSARRRVLLGVSLALAVSATAASAVSADNGPPKPPWLNPKNYTLKLPVLTRVGPVCVGSKCSYPVIGGAVLTVRLPNGKVFSTSRTNAKGRGVAHLPKRSATLTFTHGPWKGHRLGTKTIKVKGPTYMPPPSFYVFTFCLTTSC